MRIVCVGGGPAGLLLGVLLRRQGHEVTVFERRSASANPGWGVVFFDELLGALVEADAPTAAAITAHAVQWSGQEIAVDGREPMHRPGAGRSIGRATLLRILGERARDLGVDVRYDASVDVTGPRGAELPAHDLLVAADGVHSQLRTSQAAAFGTRIDERTNVFAWLGTTQRFEEFTFPFVRAGSGWAWAHAYRFDADTSCFVVEMPRAVHDELGLAGRATGDALRVVEELFAAHLGGHGLMAPPGTGDGLRWNHFPRVTNERWHAGRTVLLGDAAHTTHFSIGSGTRLAMDDAMVLARCLQEHCLQEHCLQAPPSSQSAAARLEVALDAYQARRAAELAPVQAAALNSARFFERVPDLLEVSDHHFAMLFERRRTSPQHRLPVPLYLALADAAAMVTRRAVQARASASRRRDTTRERAA